MKIVTIKEKALYENRVAITPDTASLFNKLGWHVSLEAGAGLNAGFNDQAYLNAGATIKGSVQEVINDADIILKVQVTSESSPDHELNFAKLGSVVIGHLSPYHNAEYINTMKSKGIHGIAMELVPRITKMQAMDVLSSQSNLAGYRAVIEAIYYFNKVLPMMMTAAGSLSPAKILILGVGVAGLQAIATAKRLGAIVHAYDVRDSTKEQVESLGAKFISPTIKVNNMEEKSGYAKVASIDEQKNQKEFLSSIIKNYDIVITTAQIPGQNAPKLITHDMLQLMKNGSIIVDMAVYSGGNVDGSEKDKILELENVKIIGWSNLAGKIAFDSSKLYAKNLYNFATYAFKDENFDINDDIIKQMLITG